MQRLNNILRLRPAPQLSIPSPSSLRPYSNMSAPPSAAETDSQAAAVANTSGITTESLQRTITEKLEAEHVDIEDMSGEIVCPEKICGLLVLNSCQVGVASHSKP